MSPLLSPLSYGPGYANQQKGWGHSFDAAWKIRVDLERLGQQPCVVEPQVRVPLYPRAESGRDFFR